MPAALGAGVGDADPLAAAGRAGGRDLEEPARLDDLPLAAAVVAGGRDGPFPGPEPLHSPQYSWRLTSIGLVAPRAASTRSISSLIEEVLARPRAAAALAEEVAEEAAAEDVAEGRHDVLGVAEVVDPGPFEPGMAVAVVALPLRLVGEDLVRLGRFLEPPLGLGVARVLVGVVLQGQLPIGFLDLVGARRRASRRGLRNNRAWSLPSARDLSRVRSLAGLLDGPSYHNDDLARYRPSATRLLVKDASPVRSIRPGPHGLEDPRDAAPEPRQDVLAAEFVTFPGTDDRPVGAIEWTTPRPGPPARRAAPRRPGIARP